MNGWKYEKHIYKNEWYNIYCIKVNIIYKLENN